MNHKLLHIFILNCLLILIFGWSSSLYSQNIYLSKMNDLNFGDVFVGTTSEIFHTDAGAMKFTISHGKKGGRYDILANIILPSTLNNGAYSIPVQFDINHAAWSKNDSPSGRTNFNPYLPLSWNDVRKNETIYIWIGGSLTPPSGIPPGLYQGTIIITAILN